MKLDVCLDVIKIEVDVVVLEVTPESVGSNADIAVFLARLIVPVRPPSRGSIPLMMGMATAVAEATLSFRAGAEPAQTTLQR